VYQRRQHTINVFIESYSATPDRSTPEERSVRGFHVRHWICGGLAFWAVSDLNDTELFTRFRHPRLATCSTTQSPVWAA